MKPRKVTQKEKIQMYEDFLHKINMFCTIGENDGIRELVQNADRFSYAHRQGNGENSDAEQQRLIDWAFRTLCNTPETDSKIRKRQRAYTKAQKKTKEVNKIEYITKLTEEWRKLVGCDHCKDRDFHFYIETKWSYGQPPKYWIRHYGYIIHDFEGEEYNTYEEALDGLISFLEKIVEDEKDSQSLVEDY